MRSVEEIYRENKDAVFRLALSYTGNIQDAEDITQTVFMKLLSYGRRIGKVKGWLLTVTYRECVTLFRERSHFSAQPMPELPFEEPEMTDLFYAMQTLSPEYRAAIHLLYYEGYSVKEIGKLTGESSSCITSRLHRARCRLKCLLEGEA